MAESDTTYDVPDVDANRSVADDLELCFRTFVFPKIDNFDVSIVVFGQEWKENNDVDRSNNSVDGHASRCVSNMQLYAAGRHAASLRIDSHDPKSNATLPRPRRRQR